MKVTDDARYKIYSSVYDYVIINNILPETLAL